MTQNKRTTDASNLASYGDFTYDADSRTLKGLLLPFNVASRRNASGQEGVVFTADTIDLPRDASVVSLNRHHDRHDPVGRATSLTKTERGVEAVFQLADTDEADDWLSKQKDSLRKLSAEVRFAADGIRAKLTGSALVTEGAFATAGLFALAPEVEKEEEEEEAEVTDETATEITVEAESAPESVVVTTPDGETVTYKPDADPAEETNPITEEGGQFMSIVPDAPGAVTPAVATEGALFSAIANRNSNPEALAPFAGAGSLFAISGVQASGPSGKTIEADVTVPQAVRELWKNKGFTPRYLNLVNQGTLTSPTVTGWRWVTEPTVGDYAGNLAEVPSTAVDTEPVSASASILAGGNKLDRKFYDFNDSGVVESFMRLQTEDVARKLDAKLLAAIIAGSTSTAPGTVPTDVAKGLAAIVDGALDVIATENTPSFAIVSPELWRDIAIMKDRDRLAFLDAGLNLEEGQTAGFKIIPGAVGTGKVIVGAKEAMTFYTLGGGSPIRVEGLDVHHGGVDVAVFAYYASIVNNTNALRIVTTASAE